MNYNFLKIEKPEKLEDIDILFGRSLKISNSVEKAVDRILKEVEANGDRAILKFCKKFDRFDAKNINNINVKSKEIELASKKVKKTFPDLVEALEVSYRNIKEYHNAQFKKEAGSWTIKPGKGKE
ncbi:MAG: histidinol dehydrogenase, partial [Candidatus Hydromicrobium sp.]